MMSLNPQWRIRSTVGSPGLTKPFNAFLYLFTYRGRQIRKQHYGKQCATRSCIFLMPFRVNYIDDGTVAFTLLSSQMSTRLRTEIHYRLSSIECNQQRARSKSISTDPIILIDFDVYISNKHTLKCNTRNSSNKITSTWSQQDRTQFNGNQTNSNLMLFMYA